MLEPQLHHVVCPDPAVEGQSKGSHRMAYWQWGDPQSDHVVVCAHGLTRQGRDFDVLARALCEHAGGAVRVVCPDVAGRGQSDWLKDPMQYGFPTYVADMLVLLAQLQREAAISTLDWLGTSMGGVIGLILAGQPGLPMPVRLHRLALNDIGPAVSLPGLLRIQAYVGNTGRFNSLDQAADAMWAISDSFGPHTREQWLALCRPMVKPLAGDPEGALTLHYDPALAVPMKGLSEEGVAAMVAMLWQLYDAVTVPVLLLRGAQSDVLLQTTATAMTQRGPRARLVEFVGIGHAPTLVAADQVEVVRQWLTE